MKVLSVLLIQPSSKDCIQTLFSIYNTEEGIGYKPPIGLLSIAATIHAHSQHAVDILDCQTEDINSENMHEFITKEYDVVGISAWTDFWYQATSLSAAVKRLIPNCFVVVGGPHISCYPKEALAQQTIDAIVLGDGEYPMLHLLNALSHQTEEALKNPITGVYLKESSATSFVPYIQDNLDELEFPDRSLLPIRKYTSVLGTEEYVTSMITSRGCPFSCVYCKIEHQQFKLRSSESVIEEFKAIAKLGIKEVEIYDDTFNFNHNRTIEICKALQKLNLNIKWSIRDRVDRVRFEVLQELKKAGCTRIHLGIESGSNRVLQRIGKKITIEDARYAVKLSKDAGFEVLTYFMFGLPDEDLVEAEKTIDFALELDSDYAEFSITIPYPGTKSYTDALLEGVISFDYWKEFALNPTPNYVIPCVIENKINRNALLYLRNKAIKLFYFRMSYIFRELLKVRSLHEFLKKFRMARGLFNIIRGVFLR